MKRRSFLAMLGLAPVAAFAAKHVVIPAVPATPISNGLAFLTGSELPFHTHTITDPCHTHDIFGHGYEITRHAINQNLYRTI